MNTLNNTADSSAIRELTAEELDHVGGGGFNPGPILDPIINYVATKIIDGIASWIGKHLM